MVGRHNKGRAGFIAGALNLPWTWKEERGIREHAMSLLELLGIAEWADTEATSLAFGQQRAVEFARALASEPTSSFSMNRRPGSTSMRPRRLAALSPESAIAGSRCCWWSMTCRW